jgi:hypothetical protein
MYLSQDPKNPKAYMGRLDGLQALASKIAGSGPKVPGLMSADDMKQMIASGRSPRDIAQALISGKPPPPKSAMTLDALNALQSALVPTQKMSPQELAAFNNMNDQLQALSAGMPPTASALPGQVQAALNGANGGAPVTANGAPGGMPVTSNGLPATGYAPGPGYAPGYAAAPGYVMPGGRPITAMPMNGPATAFTPGQNPLGQNVQGAIATLNNGGIPTGNTALDLANSVANSMAFSPAEQALLNQIQDPQQRAMQQLQMFMQKQSLLATMLSNLANMRHEMLKTVANNLRA